MNNRHSVLVVCLIGLLLLVGCSTTDIASNDQPDAQVLIPVVGSLGQTFLSQHAGLNALNIYLTPVKDAEAWTATVRLYAESGAEQAIATATLFGKASEAPDFRNFQFPTQNDSHNRRYYFEIEGSGIHTNAAPTDTYLNGARYVEHSPTPDDLAFQTGYAFSAVTFDLIRYGIDILGYFLAAVYLFIFPGLALTRLLIGDRSLHWGERLGLAAGASIAIYPVLFLLMHIMGIPGGRWLAWIPGAIGGLYWIWTERNQISGVFGKVRSAGDRAHWPDWTLASLIVLLVFVRILPIRSLPAPLWGDSVHHTEIVQLLVDNGGLFQSWNPYASILTFSYHFGFHSVVAVWQWLTQMDAPHSVLVAGQFLNVLAVLVLIPLAHRLSGHRRWAGVGVVLVAGFLSQMPGFYVNWGRYTQLTGQITFPVLLWTFDVWWTERRLPNKSFLLFITVLTAGLTLTHYRVATVAVAAGIAWSLWGIWLLRDTPREWIRRLLWLACAAMLAALLITPWVLIVRNGRLVTTFSSIVTRDATINAALSQDLTVWWNFTVHYPIYLWLGASVSWLLALWKQRVLAIPLLLFVPLTFLMTNPFLVGLPGTGWITNFLLLIGVYIPIAWLLAWLFAIVIDQLERSAYTTRLILPVLLFLTAIGIPMQFHVVDTSFQMVTQSDISAFRWVKANVPPDSRFLVNGFLAYNNSMAVGSDAGWWLPFYTQRANNIPPMPYATERTTAESSRDTVRQLIIDVQASNGDPTLLHAVLCTAKITHIYLGQQQGRVGYNAQPLLPQSWFQNDPDFTLVHREDDAQVWQFGQRACTTPQ